MDEEYLQLQKSKVKYEKKLEKLSRDIKSFQEKHHKDYIFHHS